VFLEGEADDKLLHARDTDGKVTDIADTWPLNATTVEDAKAEVDRQHWREPGDVADALRQDSKEERQRRPNGLVLLILMSSRVRSYLEKG
jgi:hypothetical protein